MKTAVSERMVHTLVPRIRTESEKMRPNMRGRFGVNQLIDRFDAFEHEPLAEQLNEVMEECRALGERSFVRWTNRFNHAESLNFRRYKRDE